MKSTAWMPLYVGDYIADTLHLTTEQNGAYFFLLLYAWRNGGYIPHNDQQLAIITRLNLDSWKTNASVLLSFWIEGDKPGFLTQKRLLSELGKAIGISGKRSVAGRLGGRPKKQNESKREPNAEAEQRQNETQSQSQSHISLESTGAAERPGLKEVLDEAQRIGLAEWKARDWFNEMEGCGWLDHAHRPIVSWRPVLSRVKVKWEADGRPSQPPSRISTTASNGTNVQPSVWQLTKQLEALDSQIADLKNRGGYEDAHGWHADNDTVRQQLKGLRQRRQELHNQIASRKQ